ncbi:MAG: hypothetical protein ACOC7S_02585 [Planctomycetota bacterium]
MFIPHWQDNSAPLDGDGEDEGDRMYPVCFTRNTKMKTSVEMVLRPIEAFGGNLKIKGDRADNLDIPATDATARDDKATITNATCEAAFPNYVTRYDTLDIVWSLSTDGGQSWQQVGISKNETFITLADPECSTLYRTVAYLATANGGEDVDEEEEAFDSTWGMFSSEGGPADVGGWNEASRNYDRPLHYYETESGHGNTSAAGLLQDADGQCGAWADLLLNSCRANGISHARGTEVRPPLGYSRMAIKEIAFDDDPDFPDSDPWIYSTEDLDDSPTGIPGQNMATPSLKLFALHYLVNGALVRLPGKPDYYDPSYGLTVSGPSAFTANVAAWGKEIDGDTHWRVADEGEVRFRDM